MAVTDKKPEVTTLCSVFLSFKSLLFLIYHTIHIFIQKLSGTCGISTISINTTTPNSSAELLSNGLKPGGRIKGVRDIPGPKTLPFFGTLLTSAELKSSDLMKANEERERVYGCIVKEEHFWNHPLVMVLRSDHIKKIIRENPIYRPGMEILTLYRTLRPDRYDSLGLVNSQGNMWKKLHSTFSMVSTVSFARSLLPGFNDITSDVINELGRENKFTTNFPHYVNKLIIEASFYSGFGKRMGFIGNHQDHTDKLKVFSDCHDTYWKAFHKSMYGFPWWKYFSTKVWRDFTAAEDKMLDVIAEITDTLLATDSAAGLLAAVPRDKVSKKDLTLVLLELVTGATAPVYHGLLIALYWICKYENVYDKVIEEIMEQLPTKDSPVDETVLDNIPYLKACVSEAFRICPTACNLARVLDNELQIGEYKLPPGTCVILQTWHACLQDSSFYRAKEYLPERWIFVDGAPRYRPHERQVMCNFGIGLRACPGQKIANQMIHTFLCKLLRKYKIKFTQDIDLRYEWLLVVKEPVIIELEEQDK